MGIGISIFLIATGAILAFAVNVAVSGLDLSAVGVILMVVGAIGLAVALAATRGLFGTGRRTVLEDEYGDPLARRTVRRDVIEY